MTRRTLYRLQIANASLWTLVVLLELWKMHEGRPGRMLTIIIASVIAAVVWWSVVILRGRMARDPDTK